MISPTVERTFTRTFWLALLLLGFSTGNAAAQTPTAGFTISDTTGCRPFTVSFTNTSTGASSYHWDFGNGNTSTLPNPSNVYLTPGQFTITLIATDAANQADTLVVTNLIEVVQNPVADFSASFTSTCPGNPIQFINNSSHATLYEWDLGDGLISNATNPVHTYTQPGTYTISLIAETGYGCKDVKAIPHYITVVPTPVANFSVNQQVTCNPATTFSFSNSSQHAQGYKWYFGDGQTSTVANPTHVYGQEGNFNVSMVAYGPNGCQDSMVLRQPIVVDVADTAQIIVSDSVVCLRENINFSTTAADAAYWAWDFGDGTTSSKAGPTKKYTRTGNYSVSLTTITANNCSVSVAAPNIITVNGRPNSDFTVLDTAGCAPLTVDVINSSTGGNLTYNWNFYDGSSSTLFNPQHTYTQPGNYHVRLTVTDSNGCQDAYVQPYAVNVQELTADFTQNKTKGCAPLKVNFSSTSTIATYWEWDFGDGQTSYQPNPQHEYQVPGEYTVRLITRTANGCRDTFEKVNAVEVTNLQTTYMAPAVQQECAPYSVKLQDLTANTTGWLWDFGDGTTSTDTAPTHTYTQKGTYHISLTATKPGGCNLYIPDYRIIEITGGMADFTFTVDQCPPHAVQFQDASTGSISSWEWEFDQKVTSKRQNPNIPYSSYGWHDVKLTVTTKDGCKHTKVANNAFYLDPLSASFGATPMSKTFPKPVQFHATMQGATGWMWDFGDGQTSTARNPLHTFATDSPWVVTLTIWNGQCTTTYSSTLPVIIPSSGIGAITTPANNTPTWKPIVGCSPLTVSFNDTTQGATSWQWLFGNGDTAYVRSPSYSYPEPGVYDVTLIVSNGSITDTLHYPGLVRSSAPEADFTINSTWGCKLSTGKFHDNSLNAVSWLWEFGDSTTSTLTNPVHVFPNRGYAYEVKLTVADSLGCENTVNYLYDPRPIDVLEASRTPVCDYDSVSFTSRLQGNFNYLWHFGDGLTSTSTSPTHSYAQDGNYNVSVVVTDPINSCKDTFTLNNPVRVYGPRAEFTTPDTTVGCYDLTVNFENLATHAGRLYWDFGDGQTEQADDPQHRYRNPGVYDVQLVARRGHCYDTIVKPEFITVHDFQASFSVTQQNNCWPITVQLTDQSVGSRSWDWQYGDNTSSTLQNPTHTFASEDDLGIKLTVTDSNNCQDVVVNNNLLYVKANFRANNRQGCAPLDVTFTDRSTLATSWEWHFGDGDTSHAQNPVHQYDSGGVYNVMLIITSANNCVDTITMTNYIKVWEPIADFTSPTASACAPSLVDFADLSTNATKWSWQFGDTVTSRVQHPGHIYVNPGYYTVALAVEDNHGCRDTVVKTDFIRVLGPVTNFTASTTSTCTPSAVNFTDLSTDAFTWEWNFGDGDTSSMQHPTHMYDSSGTYTVTLITTDSFNCRSLFVYGSPVTSYPRPKAAFAVSDTQVCVDETVAFTDMSESVQMWEWSFGDGSTSTQENPTHAFAAAGDYTVTLVAKTTAGCHDTLVKNQLIHVTKPEAQFTLTNTQGCVPVATSFSDSSTNAVSWQWSFGDGTDTSYQNPAHTFMKSGTYPVQLKVTDQFGCVDSVSQTVDAYPVPVVDFSTDDTLVCAPYTVKLNNYTTHASTYTWSLGNGSTSSREHPQVQYTDKGRYSIKLVAESQHGCVDSLIQPQLVTVGQVEADFALDSTEACGELQVNFTDESTNALSYNWSFGDGTTDSVAQPQHLYSTFGSYTVKLTVTDSFNCQSTKKVANAVTVNRVPEADFAPSATEGCAPLRVQLQNRSSNAQLFEWTVEDNYHPSGRPQIYHTSNTNYTFNGAGVHAVTLVAKTTAGCSDTLRVDSIEVHPVPQADFVADVTEGCLPLMVQFTNQSQHSEPLSYRWVMEQDTLTAENPQYEFLKAGSKDVMLLATTSYGCVDTAFKLNLLQIHDNVPPVQPSIRFVTVAGNDKVSLEWEPTQEATFEKYVVYRQLPAGTWKAVKEVTDPAATSFTEGGLMTLSNVYRYRVQELDVCGLTEPLNTLQAHGTINVEAEPIAGNVQVQWNAYEGCNVTGYEVYRVQQGGTPILVGQTAPQELSFLDVKACPQEYSYRIKATGMCGTSYTSYSDTSRAKPENVLANQQVEIIRSTVVDNEAVLTEWFAPTDAPEKVSGYTIARSTSGGSYEVVATLPRQARSYIDYNVNVDGQNYHYRVLATNTCDITTRASNIGSSILLQAEAKDKGVKLNWTEYKEWDTQVDYYIIQKKNEYGEWEDVEQVGSDKRNYLDK